jgi:hypothetical protein
MSLEEILRRAREILEPVEGEPGDVLYSGSDTLVPGNVYAIGREWRPGPSAASPSPRTAWR